MSFALTKTQIDFREVTPPGNFLIPIYMPLTEEQREKVKEILAKHYRPFAWRVQNTKVVTLKQNVFSIRQILDKHGYKDLRVVGNERIWRDRFDVVEVYHD